MRYRQPQMRPDCVAGALRPDFPAFSKGVMVLGSLVKICMPGLRAALTAIVAATALAGCASTIERNGIPTSALADKARVPGLEGVRYWADEVSNDPVGDIRRHTPNMPAIGRDNARIKGRPVVESLALSGGGSDGAYGAGVLAGWTERGDRPEFEVVTGVSAGAIIAPFAFLGSKYDPALKVIWTEYQQSQVVTAQFLPGLFGGSALTDTTPLAGLIAKYVDREMLDKISAEYKRGRILMVLTTNLDAQRPVVWNMGEIALDPSPEALALFRKVILASAAIPGAFPPVNIDVVADGKHYEEMHVDGGTTRELFVTPVQAPLKAFDVLYPVPPIRKIYIVKNGKVVPEQEVIPQTTFKIAARSIATLIKSQNWSELYRLYRLAVDGGADFNFTSVPDDFNFKTDLIYDPKYQIALYERGVEVGKSGVWLKAPPGQTPITVQEMKQAKPTKAQISKLTTPTKTLTEQAAPTPVKPIAEEKRIGSVPKPAAAANPQAAAETTEPQVPDYSAWARSVTTN